MKIFFLVIIKGLLFFLIKNIRLFTNRYDKKISLFLSKLNWTSNIYSKSLEITTTVGCAMMCEYCPQENYKNNGKEYPRTLDFKIFKQAMQNVSKNIKIHWTGFSEPLHCKDFPLMSNYLKSKGHKMHLSTTMYGRNNSKDFVATYNFFETIVFHLPDNKNLMKLKVDEKYLFYLKKALIFQSKNVKKENFQIMVIGEDFEKNIRVLINELLEDGIIENNQIYVRKHLVSRASQIEDKEGFRKNKLESFNDDNKKLFYCGYGRLNKGVMLTDGSLAICCNDYSLEHNSGSLLSNSLNNLYEHKKLYQDDDFILGKKALCKRCEFYKSI